jgi:hypothetical protein
MANAKHMKPLVTTCVPFSRNPMPGWAFSFASMIPPMNGTYNIVKTENQPRDTARDYLVEGALENDSKFTFFLDDDVTVPPNILRSLLFEFGNVPDDVMVIGGIYCTKTRPAMPLVFQHIGDGPFYKWRIGQVFPVELIATGAMMIRNEVFKGMPQPWFKEVHTVEDGKKYGLIPQDYKGHNFEINDDGFFCHKVREAGFRIMAHGGMNCMHWDDAGTAYVLPDTSYPIQCELDKRWPSPARDEAEHIKRVMAVYKMAYGYTDLLPMDQDMAALVQGS